MILATPMFFSLPIFTQTLSWNAIRQIEAYRHTLQLTLVTITLNRYHKVWYNGLDTHLQPSPQTSQHCSRTSPPTSTYRYIRPPCVVNDLPKGNAQDNFTTRWLMSLLGSLPIGVVRSLNPRSKR